MFLPFQRLGGLDNAAGVGNASGVGLGLTVSRGLTEAMRGTLAPEETPGGGLTMAISVPVADRPAQADAAQKLGAARDTVEISRTWAGPIPAAT